MKEKTVNVKKSVSKKTEKKKSKKKKQITKAKVFIKCTYNNTIVSFADISGNVFASSSAGNAGFKGSKKGTAFAATRAAEVAYEKASKFGVVEASVIVKGIGMGRQAAVKGLRTSGLIISSLVDKTPIPHNGCRPRKKPKK